MQSAASLPHVATTMPRRIATGRGRRGSGLREALAASRRSAPTLPVHSWAVGTVISPAAGRAIGRGFGWASQGGIALYRMPTGVHGWPAVHWPELCPELGAQTSNLDDVRSSGALFGRAADVRCPDMIS